MYCFNYCLRHKPGCPLFESEGADFRVIGICSCGVSQQKRALGEARKERRRARRRAKKGEQE